jgi:hypothetical protein
MHGALVVRGVVELDAGCDPVRALPEDRVRGYLQGRGRVVEPSPDREAHNDELFPHPVGDRALQERLKPGEALVHLVDHEPPSDAVVDRLLRPAHLVADHDDGLAQVCGQPLGLDRGARRPPLDVVAVEVVLDRGLVVDDNPSPNLCQMPSSRFTCAMAGNYYCYSAKIARDRNLCHQ